jgi:hypothetical protein
MSEITTLAQLYTAITTAPGAGVGGGYWKLSELTGDRLSSEGNNLTLFNTGVGAAVGGLFGFKSDFELSQGDFLSAFAVTAVETGDIDWFAQLWWTPESFSDHQDLMAKWGGSTNEFVIEISADGVPRLYIAASAGLAWSAGLSLATRYCIHVWHDATNNIMGIAVNAGTAVTQAHANGSTVGDSLFMVGARNISADFAADGYGEQAFFVRGVYPHATLRTALYNSGDGAAFETWAPASSGSGTGGTKASAVGASAIPPSALRESAYEVNLK